MGRGKVRGSPVDLLAEGRAGKVSLALPVADLPGEAGQAASTVLGEVVQEAEAPAVGPRE